MLLLSGMLHEGVLLPAESDQIGVGGPKIAQRVSPVSVRYVALFES